MPVLVTERDFEILSALERFPLTSLQLLKLSTTFATPFTDERRVRERLHALATAKRIRQFRYAIAGPGAPAYSLLSSEGYGLLHGPDAPPPSKRAFQELSVSRQAHAFFLAEFLVHFIFEAHKRGHSVTDFEREHLCALHIGEEAVHPDAGFQVRLHSGAYFRYYLEIDNSTERVRSTVVPDTWERKVRLYEQFASTRDERFRVLVVTTKSEARLHHILRMISTVLANKQRSLFSGVYLPHFLRQENALEKPCFLDHHLRPTPLILPIRHPSAPKQETLVLPTPDSSRSDYDDHLAVALVPHG